MNIYYDKILGRLREAGLTDNSATEIALILSELVESSTQNEINTNNTNSTSNDVLDELIAIKKILTKIYNPE